VHRVFPTHLLLFLLLVQGFEVHNIYYITIHTKCQQKNRRLPTIFLLILVTLVFAFVFAKEFTAEDYCQDNQGADVKAE